MTEDGRVGELRTAFAYGPLKEDGGLRGPCTMARSAEEAIEGALRAWTAGEGGVGAWAVWAAFSPEGECVEQGSNRLWAPGLAGDVSLVTNADPGHRIRRCTGDDEALALALMDPGVTYAIVHRDGRPAEILDKDPGPGRPAL